MYRKILTSYSLLTSKTQNLVMRNIYKILTYKKTEVNSIRNYNKSTVFRPFHYFISLCFSSQTFWDGYPTPYPRRRGTECLKVPNIPTVSSVYVAKRGAPSFKRMMGTIASLDFVSVYLRFSVFSTTFEVTR